MIRAYEKEVSWQAAGLAIAVHVALLGALLISFNWKAAHPALNLTTVELWDSLPIVEVAKPEPVMPTEVVEQEQLKAEPVVQEEVKLDIVLEKKQKVPEQKKQLAMLQEEARQEEVLDKKRLNENKTKEALKKLQEEALADEKVLGDQQALSSKAAANASIVDEFKNKIQAKIRGNVNKALCGDGNPELKFDIGLLPTGELSGHPKLVKSSGSEACDEAVARAIMASQPLPLPSDTSLYSQFRNLKLKFRPND